MSEAEKVALIVGAFGAITSLIGSGAMIAITLIKSRNQAAGHKEHEDISTDTNSLVTSTNNAVHRLEIAVNGGLDERIGIAIKEALGQQ